MSIKIKLFDRVKLKDGREGDIMEIYGDQEAFEITLGDFGHWYDETIEYDQIERVLNSSYILEQRNRNS